MTKYRAEFTLRTEVSDFDAATAFLEDGSMLLSELKDEVAECYGEEADKIVEIGWILETPNSGYMYINSNGELSDEAVAVAEKWFERENADGFGDVFDQADFAVNGDETAFFEEGVEFSIQ